MQLLTFSSDLVFDGQTSRPYIEADAVSPLNRYGLSKAEAERIVRDLLDSALIIRTSSFFGPWDEYNFVSLALRTLAAGQVFRAAADVVMSPTYVPDLVNASLDLLIDEASGVWHLSNAGEISWAALAEKAAAMAQISTSTLDACRLSDLGLPASRPRYSPLNSQLGRIMPPLDDALTHYMLTRSPIVQSAQPLAA